MMEISDWQVTVKQRNLCHRPYMLWDDILSFGVVGNYGLFIHPKKTYLIVTWMLVIM